MPRQRRIIALLLIAIVISAAALITSIVQLQRLDRAQAARPGAIFAGTQLQPPRPLTDFTLPASTGGDVSLSDWRGRWVVMFFGYTHCPDVCPTSLTEYRRVLGLLGPQADAVQVAFVSVDAERDTPDRLAPYVARFHEDFVGLTGTPAVLTAMQPEFGFYFERRTDPNSRAPYLVDHTAYSYVVNPAGELTAIYSFGTPPQQIADGLTALMAAS